MRLNTSLSQTDVHEVLQAKLRDAVHYVLATVLEEEVGSAAKCQEDEQEGEVQEKPSVAQSKHQMRKLVGGYSHANPAEQHPLSKTDDE